MLNSNADDIISADLSDKGKAFIGVNNKKDDKKDEPSAAVRKFFEDLRESSATKQLAVGGIGGWASGFVFAKFGKTAATAAGGTILLLHVSAFCVRRHFKSFLILRFMPFSLHNSTDMLRLTGDVFRRMSSKPKRQVPSFKKLFLTQYLGDREARSEGFAEVSRSSPTIHGMSYL